MGFFNWLGKKNKKEKNDELKQDIKEKVKKIEIQIESDSKKKKAFKKGLSSSNKKINEKFKKLALKHKIIDDSFFEDLEEELILADIGISMTSKIIEISKQKIVKKKITNVDQAIEFVFETIYQLYQNKEENNKLNIKQGRLNIILVVGVNGTGKTTSIAKLAKKLKEENYKVILAAADTFRAGAVAQLKEWSNRLSIDCVVPKENQKDPVSVIYDGIQKAKEINADVLICDTAGRLENKVNLMNQLQKMYRVIKKEQSDAPHETLLVLDATIGQNGIHQAEQFREITNVTGIILTKMDGTSKGGIILAIKTAFDIPVKFIGLGEGLDDLMPFDIDSYILSLTEGLKGTESYSQQ